MTHCYKNADRSFRSDPMIPRQLKITILEQKLAYYKITISALFRLWYWRLFLEEGEN